jgi:SAM-dependent methyltransferase
LQIVGETLCEAVDLRSGDKVLDVAAGNGNASLAAARRFADVTSIDWVPELLAQGLRRAEADGLFFETQVADAENLPFAAAQFDVVLSTFGVMFTAESAPRRRRDAAGRQAGGAHRPRELDAGRFRRRAVRRHRAASSRRPRVSRRRQPGGPKHAWSSCSVRRRPTSARSANSSLSATLRRRTGSSSFGATMGRSTRHSRPSMRPGNRS